MSAEIIHSRREARRRKILENSENRLNRITGKVNIKSDSDFVFVKENGLANEDDGAKRDSNFVESNESCLFFNSKALGAEYPPSRISSESRDVNISTPPASQTFGNQTLSSSSTTGTNQYKPIVFLLSAIVLRVIIGFDAYHICACSMAFGFALAETGLVLVQGLPAFDSSQFLASLLLLSGISQRKIKAFIVFNTLLSIFIKDFALFTFGFVITHVMVILCQNK